MVESLYSTYGRLIQGAGDSYYNIKSFESDGKFYESLGIRRFKKFVIGRYKNCKDKPESGICFLNNNSIEGADMFENQTMANEAVHIKGIIKYGIATGSVALIYHFLPYKPLSEVVVDSAAGTFLAGSSLIHGYCIMLQRYTRTRIRHARRNRAMRSLRKSSI